MLRKWDITDDKQRKDCIDELIARIEEEDDTSIGVIAAQEIIDIVTKYASPVAYNAGVEGAKKIIQGKFADIEIDLDISKVST